jgi:hypothetical protein
MTDIRLFVRLLRNFANCHEMLLLKDSAEGLLDLMPPKWTIELIITLIYFS